MMSLRCLGRAVAPPGQNGILCRRWKVMTPSTSLPLIRRAQSTQSHTPGGEAASAEAADQHLQELMPFLVCPLSKAPLRYDAGTNELICDKLGVAYKVLPNGIPNLNPVDARLLNPKT